ncbi:MAG: DUF2157 domain-containing protein [Thiothrix sp.]|nr:DUF2157 domain-containing protein [Thiothrix sp.]HPE59140.1 DUF2157 domain-containing protein [Thiolinea sp.]
MANIETRLALWQEQGLLSADQAQAIRTFESENSPSRRHWWLYSLLILGASIIGLGIISLIAANWADIPDTTKLGADLLLLSGLGAALLWQYRRPQGWWFEALITAFMILCLASIGLIAQIYQLNGSWFHALLFWSVMTLPITLFSRQLFAPFLWGTLFLHALVWSGVALFTNPMEDTYRFIAPLCLFAPLLAVTLYGLLRPFKALADFRSTFFFWFQISGLMALVVIDLARSGGEMRSYELSWYLPAYIAAVALILLILSNSGYRMLNKVLLVSCILLLLLYYQPDILFSGNTRYTHAGMDHASPFSFWQADDIRAPILSILILFLYATHAGNIGHARTFNIITFLIGLRFVILYFQAMGGLAATGVGLIMSGVMIIGIAWFWHKSRNRLQRWSKELNP